jgi:hypothetical protein
MDEAQFLVRRATLDDIAGLALLWERSGLQVLEMERHLTEFQLVASRDGNLEGAVALRVQGHVGLVHSEAFTQPGAEDEFRQLLWNRLKVLARNHGLGQLWTREQAPFWQHEAGFHEPSAEDLKKLPPQFGAPHERWQVASLREENASGVSFDKEFELFQQMSRANMEGMLDQARRLRRVAYVIAAIVVLAMCCFGAYLLVRQLSRPRRPRPGL